MHKYTKINNKLTPLEIPENVTIKWEVTEKMDSSNFRFDVDSWTYGSRETILNPEASVQRNFKTVISALEAVSPENKELVQQFACGLTFYGEAMNGTKGNKITYTKEFPNGVLWFEVFDNVHECWLHGHSKRIAIYSLVETIRVGNYVPQLDVLDSFPTDEQIAEYLSRPSAYGPKLEGIVIKPEMELFDIRGNRAVYKIVTQEFSERKRTAKIRCSGSEIAEVAREYITDMALSKSATRLKDVGKWADDNTNKNISPMIADLTHDILFENEEDIKNTLFKLFKKQLGSVTADEVKKFLGVI